MADIAPQPLTTPEGIEIAFYDSGGDAPAVLFANGLGGPFRAWQNQVDYLVGSYRIISWDYRGLFASPRPGPDAPVDVDAHVRDLTALLSHLEIERIACVGWSIGVQVLLEFYARNPTRISHLVSVCGSFGRFSETTSLPLARGMFPALLTRLQQHTRVFERALRRVGSWPELALWLKRLRAVSPTVDNDVFADVTREFSEIDFEMYLRTLLALGNHDADHVLDALKIPTLLIAGQRDPLSLAKLSEKAITRLQDGELLVVRGASHYALLEFPELVNLRIEKFLREHGYG